MVLQPTATVYFLQNKRKKRNFIFATVTGKRYLHFHAENLPKGKTGCLGSWLFEAAWDFFTQDQQIMIHGIRGDWIFGDNLDTVNKLTAGNRMTLEEASKQTWTYL